MSAQTDRGWSRGLSWNVAALAVAGGAGLVTNAVIARAYGPAGLGVFSQSLTWFALTAQVAALGVHYAVLRAVARSADDTEARRWTEAGLVSVLVLATAVAGISYLLAPVVARLVDSEPLVGAIRLCSIALVPHAAAKVVAAGLNGQHRMRAFSAVTGTRGAGLLLAAAGLSIAGAPTRALGGVFLVSEVLALAVAVSAWRGLVPRGSAQDARELVGFGVRAAGAAVTVEANSRVDVGVLGLLVSDRVVGIYALAATAFEGLLQVFVLLRNQVNPTLSAARTRPGPVDALHRQLWPWTVSGVGLILVLTWFAVGPAVHIAGLSSEFLAARAPLMVLLLGAGAAAAWLPFDQLLVVSGFPATQTRVVLTSLVVNIALNLALIPHLGSVGAAAATAAALVTLALGVAIRGRRLLGVRLGLPGLPAATNS